MTCMHCEERAEDCWDPGDNWDPGDAPCTCPCHDNVEYQRSSGGMICPTCQKAYRCHPLGGPLGYDGSRFLRRLCSGELVKL